MDDEVHCWLPTSGTLDESYVSKIRLMSASRSTGYQTSAAARGRTSP